MASPVYVAPLFTIRMAVLASTAGFQPEIVPFSAETVPAGLPAAAGMVATGDWIAPVPS
jgi:hypothetical protein